MSTRFLPVVALASLLLASCNGNSDSEPLMPERDATSELSWPFSPDAGGHKHNEAMRFLAGVYDFSDPDTLSKSQLIELLKNGAVACIDSSITTDDIDAVLVEMGNLRALDVYDFTGNDPSNPGYIAEWMFTKEKISETEYAEMQMVLEDSLWTLGTGSLSTDLIKQTLAIRDSSRAFWIEQGFLGSGTKFSPFEPYADLGELTADTVGALVGLAVGSLAGGVGGGVGAILGGFVGSALYIVVADLNQEACPDGSCEGADWPGWERPPPEQ